MGTDMEDIDIFDTRDLLLMRMGCDRCEEYLSSARAILYLYRNDEIETSSPFNNLAHVISLMEEEIRLLSDGLKASVSIDHQILSENGG